MGNLLGAPIVDKETHVGATEEFEYGLSSMQGWRTHMEDAHIAEPQLYALDVTNDNNDNNNNKLELPGHSLFAVFDGHGGTYSANYCGTNWLRILSKQEKFVAYAKWYNEKQTKDFQNAAEKVQYLRTGIDSLEAALKEAFVEMDQEIAMAIKGNIHPDYNKPYHPPKAKAATTSTETTTTTPPMPVDDIMAAASRAAANHASALDDDGDSGTTACIVLVTPDWLVCSNAGDSRAVFSKSQRAVPLSYDHKPDDEDEERRIRAAGGYVAGGRVEGDLAVSRGLGDFRFKHIPTVLAGVVTNTTTTSTLMSPGDQKVSPVPDIILQNRNAEQDEFIILACDGIWDVRSNQECVLDVATIFEEGESDLGLVCEEVRKTMLFGKE
jgi:serine/threonine protein phosphatase PrpC